MLLLNSKNRSPHHFISNVHFNGYCLQEKDYPISDIRVDVDCTAARSWVELDAVKMVGTKGGSD